MQPKDVRCKNVGMCVAHWAQQLGFDSTHPAKYSIVHKVKISGRRADPP